MLRSVPMIWVGLSAAPALASAVLPIGGAVGNEAGCRLYMTGDRAAEELAVLTPHTFMTHDQGCTFRQVARIETRHLAVEASCARLGEKGEARAIGIQGSGAEGYVVTSADGRWGPLLPCPGTEHLFEPPGIPV